MDVRDRAAEIHDRMVEQYEPMGSFLTYRSPWELLVATILSAQCTDARVNKVTPEVFKRWPKAEDMAEADVSEVEEVIRSTGFFRNKAKNLVACAQKVMNEFGGVLPRTMEEMVSLPGVARKTANIVLNTAMGVTVGIAVDTHVKRLAFRMGLTESDKPDKIERDLMEVFKKEAWREVNHLLVQHGRAVCTARKPDCPNCFLADICPKNGVGQTPKKKNS